MTTDLYPKRAIARREGFTVAGITKGSGMIAPNMGTMLAFIYTDAAISSTNLKKALLIEKELQQGSRLDGDTSHKRLRLPDSDRLREPIQHLR